MTLDEAIKRNPYDPKRGNEAAYCRYLRYHVEGWYQFDSKEVRSRWQKVRCRMQLVINIDDELYEIIKNPKKLETMYHAGRLCEAVRKGIPLPKGYGRLIDESKIKKCGWNFIDHHAKTDAPTIIEADRSEEE